MRLIIIVLCITFTVGVLPASALREGEHIPGQESVCDVVEGRRERGICKVYCEVLDCAAEPIGEGRGRSCDRLGNRFERWTGTAPPCEWPVDCVVSDWSEWSACTDVCDGTQNRSRDILVPPAKGGEPCPTLQEARFCGDSTPPQIDIHSPTRAEMLLQGGVGDATVTIIGTASDASSPITSLVIAEELQTVSGTNLNEPFEVDQISRWGVNIITGSATDACGNTQTVAQSYLRSGQYFAAATSPTPGAQAPQGVVAHLNQPVIDDGTRADLDDVASITELVLQSFDFDALVPPGTVFAETVLRPASDCNSLDDFWVSSAYLVRRNPDSNQHITWGGPSIDDLTAVNDGADLHLWVGNISIPLSARGQFRECALGIPLNQTLDVDGLAGATHVDASGRLEISLSGENPQVSLQSSTVNIEGIFLDLDCDWADFLCGAITDLVMPAIATLIEDELKELMETEIPPVVEGFFNGFRLDNRFALSPPFTQSLNTSSGLDYLSFSRAGPTGSGELGLYTQIYPDARGATIPPEARGAIRKNGARPFFSTQQYPFGMGLKDDLINQLFWTVWYGGNLHIPDLYSVIGGAASTPGIDVSLFATLPPVLMTSRTASEIEIGIGDAYLDASFDLGQLIDPGLPVVDATAYVSTIIGGELGLDPASNELLTALDLEAIMHIEVISIDDASYQETIRTLLNQVAAEILSDLLARILISFSIPEFDLVNIDNGLTGITLRLTNGSMDRANNDYHRLTGNLEGVLHP